MCRNNFVSYFSEPKEFEDQLEALFCKTVPTQCKFPFVHMGVTYHQCTTALLEEEPDDPDKTREAFSWCATEVLEDRKMKKGKWGVCDLQTCEVEFYNETPETICKCLTIDTLLHKKGGSDL